MRVAGMRDTGGELGSKPGYHAVRPGPPPSNTEPRRVESRSGPNLRTDFETTCTEASRGPPLSLSLFFFSSPFAAPDVLC